MKVEKLFPCFVGIQDVSILTQETTTKNISEYFHSDQCKQQCQETPTENVRTTFLTERNFIEVQKLDFLKGEIISAASKFSNQINLPRKEQDLYIHSSWINIFEKNQTENQHTHSLHFISGCYYVAADEMSGMLTFPDPCPDRTIWNDFHTQATQENNLSHVNFAAKNGRIVLFPSWMPHFVTKNNSNIRISIAFNINSLL